MPSTPCCRAAWVLLWPDMERQEYTSRVLACLRRLTPAEKQDVLAELDAHMEDHICALLELGYDEALAEERTMAAMGDPEEVGREMDKAYPLRWLIVEKATKTLAVVLGCLLVFNLATFHSVWGSIRARMDPNAWEEEIDVELDVRMEVGDDVLYIYGTGMDEDNRFQIFYCWYDKNPLGYIVDNESVDFYDCRGEKIRGGGGWSANARTAFHEWRTNQPHEGFPFEDTGEILSGDTYVTAVVERHGVRYEAVVPLVWKEGGA